MSDLDAQNKQACHDDEVLTDDDAHYGAEELGGPVPMQRRPVQ